MKQGLATMGFGLLIAFIGLAVTAATYAAASNSGHHAIAWGAIVVGIINAFRGLFQFLGGAVAAVRTQR
jgi:hypothetical protein